MVPGERADGGPLENAAAGNEQSQVAPPSEGVSAHEGIEMTVDELMRLCLEHPYEVLEQHNGQSITVTGVIRDVWPNKFTFYSRGPRFEFHHEFTLETDDFGPSQLGPLVIECDSAFRPTEAETRQTLAGIQVGQPVTVSGDLSFSMGPSYTIKIRGASIVDSEPAPENAPPAEEFMTLDQLAPLLAGYGEQQEAGEEAVKACNRAFSKFLTEDGAIPADMLESMQHLPEIEKLLISEPISAEGLGQLATLPPVRTLQISHLSEGVTGADLAVLSDLAGMQAFRLAPVNDERAEAVAGFTSLRHVSLTRENRGAPHPSPEAVADIAGLPLVDSIELHLATDEHFAPLAGMENLRVLNVNVTRINGSGLALLAPLPRLRKLELVGTPETLQSLNALQELTSLRCLQIVTGNDEVGDLEFLQGLSELQVLDMRSVNIGPGSGANLDGLGELQLLKILSSGMTDDELAAFSETSKQYLKVLDLSDCRSFGDAGLSAFSQQSWPQLFELHLDNSQVGDDGLEALAMVNAPHLERIFLNGTNVTDAGIAHFKEWERKPYFHVNSTAVTREGLDALNAK